MQVYLLKNFLLPIPTTPTNPLPKSSMEISVEAMTEEEVVPGLMAVVRYTEGGQVLPPFHGC
jgi:hypothetical protein